MIKEKKNDNLSNTQINILQKMMEEIEPWLSPQMLENRVNCWMREQRIPHKWVRVCGNVRHCKVMITFQDETVIILYSEGKSPLYTDAQTLLKMFCNINDQDHQNIEEVIFRPKIVLINLCDVKLRPVPRLNLSTGVITSYLRAKDAAEVTVIDMQMGMNVKDVVQKCKELKPDLVGMSVDFKEYDIAERMLEEFEKEQVKCTKVLGNILPALLSQKFLDSHPDLLISYGEGEESWCDLALWKAGKISFEAISGIRYLENGEIKQTSIRYIDMKDCKTPALDTLPDLLKRNGILTLELSRGCDYSACAFCPREHKTSFWRGMPPEVAVNQIEELIEAAQRIGLPPFIYFADEEIVGELRDGAEYKRIERISQLLIQRKVKCTLNASVRADSLYNPKKSREQSEEILHAWRMFKKAGLEKLFIGVESGSKEQLKRYGKGTTKEQNIIAIRTATALGIKVRVGFVMFDPLMEDKKELRQNMEFLARKDAVLKPMDDTIQDSILLNILEGKDKTFVSYAAGAPIYRYVSYLFSGLEVFVKAPYFQKVKQVEKNRNRHLIGTYDWELGKVKTEYLDKEIGMLQKKFEKWIQKNYSLTYTLKCLAKNAPKEEKDFLYRKVFEYRELFYHMAVCVFAENDGKLQEDAEIIGKKYGIFMGNDVGDIMQQWDREVMEEYLAELQKQAYRYIASKEKRELINKVIGERWQKSLMI